MQVSAVHINTYNVIQSLNFITNTSLFKYSGRRVAVLVIAQRFSFTVIPHGVKSYEKSS